MYIKHTYKILKEVITMVIKNQTKIVLITEMELKRQAMQTAFSNNTTLSSVIRNFLNRYILDTKESNTKA